MSYWRRLVHARIDLLEAESGTDRPLTHGRPGPRARRHRRRAGPARRWSASGPRTRCPTCPSSTEMWATEVDPHDAGQVEDAARRGSATAEAAADRRTAARCTSGSTRPPPS